MKKIIFSFILCFFIANINQINASSNVYNRIINAYIKYKDYRNIDGAYPTTKGSILVTPDKLKNILPLGHAAIVENKNYVYEATAKGVVRGLNNWNKTKKITFGLKVNNTTSQQLNEVMDYIKKQENKKYNFNFFNTKIRDKFYCSQLIFSAFYDVLDINLDTNLFGNAAKKGAIHPLELVLSKNTKVVYFNENT